MVSMLPTHSHRECLVQFYSRVAPQKLQSVDSILSKFTGAEEKMYRVLERLYPGEAIIRPVPRPASERRSSRRWSGAIKKIKTGVRLAAAPNALGGLARMDSTRSLLSGAPGGRWAGALSKVKVGVRLAATPAAPTAPAGSGRWAGALSKVKVGVRLAAAPTALGGMPIANGTRRSLLSGAPRGSVVPAAGQSTRPGRRGSTASVGAGAMPMMSSVRQQRRGSTAAAQGRRASVASAAALAKRRQLLRRGSVAPAMPKRPSLRKVKTGTGSGGRGGRLKRIGTVRLSDTDAAEVRANLRQHLQKK